LFVEVGLGHPFQIGCGDGADSIEVGLIEFEVTGNEPADSQRGGLVGHGLALAGVVGQHLVAGFLQLSGGDGAGFEPFEDFLDGGYDFSGRDVGVGVHDGTASPEAGLFGGVGVGANAA
jgi:hypothetical protein